MTLFYYPEVLKHKNRGKKIYLTRSQIEVD